MTTASHVSDSRVTDEMVRRADEAYWDEAAKNWASEDDLIFMRAALEAALACQGPVVTVSELEELRSKIEMEPYPSAYDEVYYDGCRDALMSAIDLTALIAKANGHDKQDP